MRYTIQYQTTTQGWQDTENRDLSLAEAEQRYIYLCLQCPSPEVWFRIVPQEERQDYAHLL